MQSKIELVREALAATRKRFQLPSEPVEFTAFGGKISRIHVEIVPDGSVMGNVGEAWRGDPARPVFRPQPETLD